MSISAGFPTMYWQLAAFLILPNLMSSITALLGCDENAFLPKITLTGLTEEIDLHLQQTLQDKKEIIMPNSVKSFVLNCSSNQPIVWKFSGPKANTVAQFDEYKTYDEFWDWSKFCYFSNIVFTDIREEITGAYECIHATAEPPGSSSLVVYAGHNSQEYIIYRGKTINITGKGGDSTIYFPCAVNNPESVEKLNLYEEIIKDSISTWEKVSAIYTPWSGFTLATDGNFNQKSRRYKCATGLGGPELDTKDVVHFNYFPPPDTIFNPTFGKTQIYLLSYNHPAYTFSCNSNSPVWIEIDKPIPRINYAVKVNVDDLEHNYYAHRAEVTLSYKESKPPSVFPVGEISCKRNSTGEEVLGKWRHQLSDKQYGIGLSLDYNTRTSVCFSAAADDIKFYYAACETITECHFKAACLVDETGEFCEQNPSISMNPIKVTPYSQLLQLPKQSGIVRCKSPDVEAEHTFVLQTDGEYFDNDTSNFDFLSYCNPKTNIKAGDVVDCHCKGVKKGYVQALIWAFGWNNDSVLETRPDLIVEDTGLQKSTSFYERSSKIRIPHQDVSDVSCVTLYSRAKWGNRNRQDVTVQARPVLIHGRSSEHVKLKTGDPVNLECIVDSYPPTTITWTTPQLLQDQADSIEKVLDRKQLNETLQSFTFKIAKFSNFLEGEYTCEAQSSSGEGTRKKFILETLRKEPAGAGAEEGSSGGSSLVGIIIAVLVVISASSLGLFIFWIRRRRRRIVKSKKAAEVAPGPSGPSSSSPLTEKDIEEFIKGNTALIGSGDDGYVNAQKRPYDSSKYEIHRENLEINNQSILGAGAYGVVLRGTCSGGNFKEPIPVAVKMVKPNAEPEYIKSLLSELKVMVYIGANNHMAELIGACTGNLNQKELFILLRLYTNGGLDEYLRKHRKTFINQVVKGKLNKNISPDDRLYENNTAISTTNLIRWSKEIAEGMNYLASKKVIHGDLATRNVLLDENLVAKISDFGLSRQLYEYTQYMKTQQAPLPWRWMAMESLRDMNFSIQSDVWSYGVTLWELFTLAEVPYPGLSWGPEFMTMVTNGYRMSKPKYAPFEIYEMMLATWQLEPDDRPTFADQIEKLEEILDSLTTTTTSANNSNPNPVERRPNLNYIETFEVDDEE